MQPGKCHRRRLSRLKHQLRRVLERNIRIEALAFARWCRHQKLRRADVASRLRISPSALSLWERGWRQNRLQPRARGRPAHRANRATRNLVITLFHVMGPGLGVPALMQMVPGVSRRELEDLARRYRDVYRRRRIEHAAALRWTQPGAVWAIDFTQPPLPVDDLFGHILVVRDLASGNMLAALPVLAPTAAVVRDLLRALFLEHGAPLVLKSDNGSALVAEIVAKLLDDWGTLALLSPPRTPRYNGACEAGIGGLKVRAHHESARFGRAGQWTCDDVEVARLMANETARPCGVRGPTPDVAWSTRLPITPCARELLGLNVELSELEVKLTYEEPLHQAAIRRIAIMQALIELSYLDIRRRRITPAVSRREL